jgi:SAM-dependent methyltransferase
MAKTLLAGLLMTPVSEISSYVLVCDKRDFEFLLANSLCDDHSPETNGLYLIPVVTKAEELEAVLNAVPQRRVRRYLDRFYLWGYDNAPDVWQRMVDKFFELIAYKYETFIDVERNRENIGNLLLMCHRLGRPTQQAEVIDYGCGTGLSLTVADGAKSKIVGVDRSKTMRQIARSKGMTVWSFHTLELKPHNSLAGAFASYVLHLSPSLDGIGLLWDRIRQGGVLVANFHKNHGVERVTEYLQPKGCLIQKIESPTGAERHGVYIAYVKS